MLLRIRAVRTELAPDERHRVERRLRLVLGRVAARIERLEVGLAAGDAPAEEAVRCRLSARLGREGRARSEASAASAEGAAELAAWRLERRLGRTLELPDPGSGLPASERGTGARR